LGVGTDEWDPQGWKEVVRESGRLAHFAAEFLIKEVEIAVYPSEMRPFAHFELHFVSTCFAFRRMSEKRLLTDDLESRLFSFKTYKAVRNGFRLPFHGNSGGNFYANFEGGDTEILDLSLRQIANEVIHSSQLGLSDGDSYFDTGILVASDFNQTKRIILVTLEKWAELCGIVRRDQVVLYSDQFDPKTGHVTSERGSA